MPTTFQRPFRRAGERLEIRATSCSYDGKLSLKADEPKVGQRHEDVEKKWEHCHIIIFPKRAEGMIVIPEIKLCSEGKLAPHSDLWGGGCFKNNHQQGNQYQKFLNE